MFRQSPCRHWVRSTLGGVATLSAKPLCLKPPLSHQSHHHHANHAEGDTVASRRLGEDQSAGPPGLVAAVTEQRPLEVVEMHTVALPVSTFVGQYVEWHRQRVQFHACNAKEV